MLSDDEVKRITLHGTAKFREMPYRQSFPLHYAALQGDLEQLQKLVESGEYDLNAYDNLGLTPLIHAVVGGRVRIPAFFGFDHIVFFFKELHRLFTTWLRTALPLTCPHRATDMQSSMREQVGQ